MLRRLARLRRGPSTAEALEDPPDVVMLVRDGTVSWVSPSIRAVLGWTQEDVVGRDARSLVGPAGEDWGDGEIGPGLPGLDRPGRQRLLAQRADGTMRWVEAEARLMPEAIGEPGALVATVRGVTM